MKNLLNAGCFNFFKREQSSMCFLTQPFFASPRIAVAILVHTLYKPRDQKKRHDSRGKKVLLRDVGGAHNPERATSMRSCHGVFTDQFIFRTVLARILNIF